MAEPENKKTQILQLLAELSGEEIKDSNGVIPGYETQVLTYLAAMSGEEIKDTGGVIPGFETQVLKHLAALAGGGGGGGGGLKLLNTKGLGNVNSNSTTQFSLGISVRVESINDYDLLLVVSSVNSVTNGRHEATASLIILTTLDGETKTDGSIVDGTWNCRTTTSGGRQTYASTWNYGVFPGSIIVSGGNVTINMSGRFDATSVGTLNGSYTARVYGIKLADLIAK